jgi:hypothetical protein
MVHTESIVTTSHEFKMIEGGADDMSRTSNVELLVGHDVVEVWKLEVGSDLKALVLGPKGLTGEGVNFGLPKETLAVVPGHGHHERPVRILEVGAGGFKVYSSRRTNAFLKS